MEKYLEILRKCSLFEGIEEENLLGMLECLGAKVNHYEKNETVIAEGQPAKYVGIELSGAVQIEQRIITETGVLLQESSLRNCLVKVLHALEWKRYRLMSWQMKRAKSCLSIAFALRSLVVMPAPFINKSFII